MTLEVSSGKHTHAHTYTHTHTDIHTHTQTYTHTHTHTHRSNYNRQNLRTTREARGRWGGGERHAQTDDSAVCLHDTMRVASGTEIGIGGKVVVMVVTHESSS